jgi:hypothetical protein
MVKEFEAPSWRGCRGIPSLCRVERGSLNIGALKSAKTSIKVTVL